MAAYRGEGRAWLWYWGQVLNVLPRKLCHSAFWGVIMFANCLKATPRPLSPLPSSSFINISGLAIGMACCILILLWVRDELSYDRFHQEADQIYRVVQDIQFSDHQTTWAITHGPLAPALQEAFPEIINTARFTESGRRFRYKDQSFQERGAYADPGLFEIFTFPFVKGDPQTALLEPASVVLSEEMAAKFFGDEDPIGAVINASNQYDFTVTGVFENVPENSTLQFDYVIPFIFTREPGFTVDHWRNSQFSTFVLLDAEASVAEVNRKIAGFLDDKPTIEENAVLRLQPISDLHLFSNLESDYGGMGDISYVYTFSLIALFILVI
ncbi:MAG: ABC transporter permease, partial [Bacteroidetes bacterium]|nr:ABC transporter permease [Bacteroidota bacterium]